MSALVLPFPLARRQPLIQRQADAVACRPDGEFYVRREIRRQSAALRRRGIEEETIRRELLGMVRAVESRLNEYCGRSDGSTGGAA